MSFIFCIHSFCFTCADLTYLLRLMEFGDFYLVIQKGSEPYPGVAFPLARTTFPISLIPHREHRTVCVVAYETSSTRHSMIGWMTDQIMRKKKREN